MAKILADFVGAVYVDGLVLVAGDEIPAGVSVGAHLTGEREDDSFSPVEEDSFDPLADEPEPEAEAETPAPTAKRGPGRQKKTT